MAALIKIMRVKHIMTKKVISVHSDTPVNEAARLIFEKNLTGMPVIDDKKRVVGIITEYDFMSRGRNIHIPTFLDLMKEFRIQDTSKVKKKIKQICQLKVGQLMTSPVTTVSPETKIQEAARIFVEKHINPLPVVDAEEKLVGIISRADIVKLFELKNF